MRETLLAHGLYVIDMSFEDPPLVGASAADVEGAAHVEVGEEPGGGGDVAMQDVGVGGWEGESAGAAAGGGMRGEQEKADVMEEEIEVTPPHMEWTFKVFPPLTPLSSPTTCVANIRATCILTRRAGRGWMRLFCVHALTHISK